MPRHRRQEPIVSSKIPNVNFSFQYYDTSDSNRFCLSQWSGDDVKTTLLRLKDICEKSFSEVVRQRQVYHFFPTDWSVSKIFPDGFPAAMAGLNSLDPFHFMIVGLNNQRARVFGAVSGSTFYVVWFDYNHEIIPSNLKNT